MTDDDIIAHLLRAFWAKAPELPETTIKELNRAARLFWGGSRPYVPKLGPPELRLNVPTTTRWRWRHRGHRR